MVLTVIPVKTITIFIPMLILIGAIRVTFNYYLSASDLGMGQRRCQ